MKRILVVENDPAILDLLIYILTSSGYGTERAESGKEASEKSSSEAFDAILLDIHLDDIDGKMIYRQLKERSPELAKRIIFVTGDIANPETRSFIEQTGNRSLLKPFTLKQVKQLMEQFFLVTDP
jgi:DNA-binding response OmpR family regulator